MQPIIRTILTAAAPLSLLALGACATPFRADVARFQQLPVPSGQTFVVRPADASMRGLEFATYANLVTQRLAAEGYRPSAGGTAELIVTIDYGVDNGREKIVTRYDPFWGPGFGWGGWGGGWGGYGRFGRGFYGGWNDPFFGGWGGWGGGTSIDSYTYYTSYLDMRIARAGDGQAVFEGHAKARSANDRLTEIVPNLVTAMFSGFPGRSGEEIRITIPPARRGERPVPYAPAPGGPST